MYFAVGRNRMYAVQGRASTNETAERARELFREDERLARYYNEELAGGKWSHLMDQTHIGYTYWQQPVRNAMPAVQEMQVPAGAEMGVSVEGSEASWPESPREAALPQLTPFEPPRYFDIFNRGRTPFAYTVEASEPWLRLSREGGTLTNDERVWVSADWRSAPVGATRGRVTVTGPDGRKVSLAVPVSNPPEPKREQVEGFVESDGYVSIEAEHYARAVAPGGTSWQLIPDFGRTLSGLTPLPVTMRSRDLSDDGMRLEYRVYLFSSGPVSVDVYLAPTLKFLPGAGLRYAVSFDTEVPQVVNVHANETQAVWERSVKDGVRVVTSKHVLKQPGPHVLKLWVVDPGLVFEKLVVNTGGVRPSYLGPPESFHRGLPPRKRTD
jgi:hypothetical protein